MPDADLSVKDGMDSISKGLIYIVTLAGYMYPYCNVHGAMLRMSKEGIYRCPTCHIGCFRVEI